MQDHTRSLARGLALLGHDVEVIANRHPDGLVVETRDDARWHYLASTAQHPRLPRRGRDWLAQTVEAFEALHRERPFDVVHSESTSAIGLVRKGVHRRVPVVVRFHGNTFDLGRAAILRARAGSWRDKVREAKALVWLVADSLQYGQWYRFRPCVWSVPSQQEFEGTLKDCLLRRSLGRTIANGIDADLFRPRAREATRRELGLADGPLLAAVGRLNREKGFDVALRALAELDGPFADARLVIVGDGEERAALERLIEGAGLQQRVLLVGAHPHAAVARYIAAADVFLFPTLRAEAAPLILPQAMATATPVIASRIGGIPEVVGSSDACGVLVPPGDVDALAAGIRSLLADPETRQRVGAAARERILAGYTVERMVEQTIELYELAIARQARRPSRGRRLDGG